MKNPARSIDNKPNAFATKEEAEPVSARIFPFATFAGTGDPTRTHQFPELRGIKLEQTPQEIRIDTEIIAITLQVHR